MRHNLRQEEVGRGLRLEQILQPADEDPCADSPSHKLQFGLSPTNRLTELPPTLDAAARADSGVSPKHDQRSEPMLPGTVGVVEVVVKCVLRRQKRDDSIPRRIVSEISDEMAQVVFLLLSDGAIVRRTYVSFFVSPRTAWYVSIQASIPAAESSSEHGGRSSAATG